MPNVLDDGVRGPRRASAGHGYINIREGFPGGGTVPGAAMNRTFQLIGQSTHFNPAEQGHI